MDRQSSMPGSDAASVSAEPLLRVRGLCKSFPIRGKGFFHKQIGEVKAVNDVNFDLAKGETLGIVGESGSGKTTAARAILRALTPSAGQVLFRTDAGKKELGRRSEAETPASGVQSPVARTETGHEASAIPWSDLAKLGEAELKPLRQQMQMIFQDPFSSLNPRMTVGDIVGEPLIIHRLAKGGELKDRVSEALSRVGLKPEHRSRYPHAFSGGQRQRIGIARALIMNPSLVVADEAVSALDVSVQAQVINLLEDLQEELDLTCMFIAHDLSVVRHICDRAAVMYCGKIVEIGAIEDLFNNPLHPYTQALLAAIPHPDPDARLKPAITGETADPARAPSGCSFHPRCPHAEKGLCDVAGQSPPAREIKPGCLVSCFKAGELSAKQNTKI